MNLQPNSFALAGYEDQSSNIFRNEVGPCVCIGVSELRPRGLCLFTMAVSSQKLLVLGSLWARIWRLISPLLCIKYLLSDICRNPVRIWRNYYQSLFSVRENWFWACVKTGVGSWLQMGISRTCSFLSRGCKAWAGSAASSLLFCILLQIMWPSPRACVTPDLILVLWAAVVVMVLVKCHLVFWPVASWLWLTCTVVCDAQCQVIK